MIEKHLRQRIRAIIIGLYGNPLWIRTATPEQKRRLDAATDAMVSLFLEAGYRLTDTAMEVVHHPRRVIPEETLISFNEMDYGHLAVQEEALDVFGNRGPGETHFIPEVATWLDENAPGWSVTWDRGDIGEGYFIAELSMPSPETAQAFIQKFGIVAKTS